MSEKSLAHTHHASYTMAGLLGLGGLYGAIAKGSRASLIGSAVFAAGYLAAGLYAQQGEYLLSNQLGALTGGALTVGMGLRYLSTRSKVPLIVSTIGAASTTFHAIHWSKIEPIQIEGLNVSKKNAN